MQRIGFDFIAISAGTARAIYELCNPVAPPMPSGERGRVVRFADIYALEQRLCTMNSVERSRLPGLDPRRIDSIVSGVILVRSLLEVLHADQYTLCEAALREGLIADYAAKN